MAPKEKRRNSEKRKEKSRDAARCRRSKESEIFTDMANLLPVPTSVSSQLDKASVMRLAIAFLKTRSLLESGAAPIEWPWLEEEEEEQLEALSLPQALGGILMALTPEGDIAYLTENVTQHLGLPHMDVMGQSIYDYCHPCDHEELRNALSLVKDDEDPLDRSFFLRFKSTLSSKSRTGHNLKAASYKVMNCSGRIMMADNTLDRPSGATQLPLGSDFGDEEEEDNDYEDTSSGPLRSVTESYAPSHFLVFIAESIPHPSNIDVQMDSRTFLTKHSLDMAYTHVDEKIEQFLGYTAKELMNRSAYEMHHVLDHDVVSKCYKTMFAKGQVQIPPYRFVARQGGYAWVQTQATLIYGTGRDSGKPQAVVCVHTCLSEIEEEGGILCTSQAAVVSASAGTSDPGWDIQQPTLPFIFEFNKQMSLKKDLVDVVDVKKPQKMTSKLFQPRTADMNSGFLKFDDTKGTIICKEEMDDLTHLAPTAGDSCIPLDLPTVVFPADYLMTFDPADLSPEVLDDCFPLAGFEFPILPSNLSEDDLGSPEFNSEKGTERSDSVLEDPFFAASSKASPFFQDSPSSNMTEDSPSLDDPPEMTQQSLAVLSDDEEELNRRAPYIPMSDSDDLPIFDATELFCDLDLDTLPLSVLNEVRPLMPKESVLSKLLQDQQQRSGGDDVNEIVHPPASKRSADCSSLADELTSVTIPKRLKEGSFLPGATSPSWRVDGRPFQTPSSPPWPMRAANTMSLIELLTEDGRNDPLQRSRPLRKASVLENLLVSGQDPITGHNLLPRAQSMDPASLRPFIPNPFSFSTPNSSSSSGLKGPANNIRKCMREGSPIGGVSDDDSISNGLFPNLMMDSSDVFNSLDDLSLVVSSQVVGNKKNSILG